MRRMGDILDKKKKKMELIQKLHGERKRTESPGWAFALFLFALILKLYQILLASYRKKFKHPIDSFLATEGPQTLPGPEATWTII